MGTARRARTVEKGHEILASEVKSKTGILVVISAPSGCGKTTVVQKLLKKHSDWVRSVSVTTRSPREGEKRGEDYFFVTPEAFETMREKEELLESAQVFDQYYGTPKSFVFDHYKENKCVLLTLDIQGAEQVRERLKQEQIELFTIFILPPSLKILKERLEGRQTDSLEEIEKRIKMAGEEIKAAGDYNLAVVNHNVDDTVHEIEKKIEEVRKNNNK